METVEPTEQFSFISTIKCAESAVNGIIPIQITNIKELWKQRGFKNCHNECLRLIYKTNIDETDNVEENVWQSKSILLGNINIDGSFHIKLPVHLHHYSIQFCIQAINAKTKEIMSGSEFHFVNIPSFLSDTSYKIGDIISFRDENIFYVRRGKIIELLSDNKFKLGYVEYDHSLGEPQQSNAWVETESVMDKSRIYRPGLNLQYEIDMIDPSEMHKLLLIKRKDTQSIAVFDALYDVYGSKSLMHCVEMFGFKQALIYWESMAVFVAKNIFDFLYTKQFEYRVNCLMDDGTLLQMMNLRQSDIRTYYKGTLEGVDMGMAIFDAEDIDYSCDWCRAGLRGWHFVYQCNVGYCDRHDICLHCVYTVIKLSTELQQWLETILNNELNLDCVNVIVDFVIGRVVCV